MPEDLTCCICEITFSDENELTRHTMEMHGESVEDHPCPFCSESFESHDELHLHMKKMHEIISPG